MQVIGHVIRDPHLGRLAEDDFLHKSRELRSDSRVVNCKSPGNRLSFLAVQVHYLLSSSLTLTDVITYASTWHVSLPTSAGLIAINASSLPAIIVPCSVSELYHTTNMEYGVCTEYVLPSERNRPAIGRLGFSTNIGRLAAWYWDRQDHRTLWIFIEVAILGGFSLVLLIGIEYSVLRTTQQLQYVTTEVSLEQRILSSHTAWEYLQKPLPLYHNNRHPPSSFVWACRSPVLECTNLHKVVLLKYSRAPSIPNKKAAFKMMKVHPRDTPVLNDTSNSNTHDSSALLSRRKIVCQHC